MTTLYDIFSIFFAGVCRVYMYLGPLLQSLSKNNDVSADNVRNHRDIKVQYRERSSPCF